MRGHCHPSRVADDPNAVVATVGDHKISEKDLDAKVKPQLDQMRAALEKRVDQLTLFLGGWHAPAAFLEWVPSYVWFFGKLLVLICGFIWARGTLPRLRMDQLMNLAWKFMLPMALANLVAAGVWHFMAPGVARWLACLTLVGAAYAMLGPLVFAHKNLGKRTYRFAE